MASLKIVPANGGQEREISLGEELVTLGRGPDNTLVLEDQAASRHHARIVAGPLGLVIEDLGSSNGTWINRERIDNHKLFDGDEIKIGATTLVFSDPHHEEAVGLADPAGTQEAVVTRVQSVTVPAPPLARAEEPAIPPPPVGPPPVAAQHESSPPLKSSVQAPVVSVTPPPPAMRDTPPAIRASSARPFGEVAAATGANAGFGIRLGAYLIDAIILGVAMVVIMVPVGILTAIIGPKSPGSAAVVGVVGWLLCMGVGIGYLLVPWARSGTTPGKKILKIRIVREDGVEPLGFPKAGLRLLGYLAGGMVFYVGFIMIAFTDGHKGLHDMIAGTKVVKF